jgi:hypothetical protein
MAIVSAAAAGILRTREYLRRYPRMKITLRGTLGLDRISVYYYTRAMDHVVANPNDDKWSSGQSPEEKACHLLNLTDEEVVEVLELRKEYNDDDPEIRWIREATSAFSRRF